MAEGVLVGLVDTRGWLLMQERDEKAPVDPDRWALIGGAVEPGESMLEAARRELEEETGIVNDDLRSLGAHTIPCEVHGEDHLELFTAPTSVTDGDVQCGEGRQIVFVPPDKIEHLNLNNAARTLYRSVLAAHPVALLGSEPFGTVDARCSRAPSPAVRRSTTGGAEGAAGLRCCAAAGACGEEGGAVSMEGLDAGRVRGADLMKTLATRSMERGIPLGWYEELYAAAESGDVVVPWDRGMPTSLLADWFRSHPGTGATGTAVVVGCGYGDDAELVAAQGFVTTAFDIAPSAIAAARRRRPDSLVRYVAADLLDLPSRWRRAFDMVVECTTVQSLPRELHSRAAAAVASLCAEAGTVLIVARQAQKRALEGPPWLLTDEEVGQFGVDGVTVESIETVPSPGGARWLVELRRSS